MTKREKIIARLQDLSVLCAGHGEIQTMRTLDDAIALLKEQEARVLGFNELKFDTVYWMDRMAVLPWPVALRRMRGNPEYLVFEDYYGDVWDVSKYGVREGGWRCWTSRPDEYLLENTPWEEQR